MKKKEKIKGRFGNLSLIQCSRCNGRCDNYEGYIYYSQSDILFMKFVCEKCNDEEEKDES